MLSEPAALFVAALAIVLAYIVFSLVGFGSALIASAPLATLMPVSRVVPLLALLDGISAVTRGWKARRLIAPVELARLAPGMVVGQLIGVLMLSRLPATMMAVLMGSFIALYGLRGLAGKSDFLVPGPAGAVAHGVAGGMLGGLFGSGGFMYASYLQRRLQDREAFRATQAVLIALSAAWRISLCVIMGLIDARLLATAVALLPFVLAGVWLGRRIDLRLTRDRLSQALNWLLVVSGAALIARFLP